jgi:hypothetical protein
MDNVQKVNHFTKNSNVNMDHNDIPFRTQRNEVQLGITGRQSTTPDTKCGNDTAVLIVHCQVRTRPLFQGCKDGWTVRKPFTFKINALSASFCDAVARQDKVFPVLN